MRYLITSCLILAADRLSKYLVMHTMVEGESIPILAPVFYLTYVRNSGAAFGLLKGGAPLLAGLALLGGLGCLAVEAIMAQGWRVRWGTAAALSGALGNMIDRLVYGSVVDFFDIRIWPIFNVADLAISCGVVLLFWEVLAHDRR